MKNLLKLTLCAALLLAPVALYAQDGDAEPSVSTTAIKGNLHLLQGKGGNVVASVGEDGILIIDDDYAEYAAAYHAALKQLSGGAGIPRFVINTHWHFDHVGTNGYWGERGSIIMAHSNVYQRMSTRQEMKAFKRVVEASPKAALPVVTYGDSILVHFNAEQLEIQHFPRGHTDGDSVVFFVQENVVHMGDHFFKDRFPFVDVGSGGNVLSYAENVASILARIDDTTVVVPGHGSLANKADLQRYHHMLTTTTAAVSGMLDQGMSVEDISAQGLGEEWESYGKGFINTQAWISFIAASR